MAGLLERRTRGIGAVSSNGYLAAVKRFSRWLARDRRLPFDPLAHLSAMHTASDKRHERRTLPSPNLGRFLEVTAIGRSFRGVTGPDRVMIYTLGLYTGLRASELASLTPRSFDLDAEPPTATVEAACSKHRRKDVQPLRRDVAEAVRAYIAGRPPNEPLWPGKWRKDAAFMIRRDLEAAGIPYEDQDGKVLDFHGLRHSFLSSLAESGVHPKVAQILARHSSITMTMDRYTHLERIDVARGLDSLPSLPGAQDTRKTAESGRRRA